MEKLTLKEKKDKIQYLEYKISKLEERKKRANEETAALKTPPASSIITLEPEPVDIIVEPKEPETVIVEKPKPEIVVTIDPRIEARKKLEKVIEQEEKKIIGRNKRIAELRKRLEEKYPAVSEKVDEDLDTKEDKKLLEEKEIELQKLLDSWVGMFRVGKESKINNEIIELRQKIDQKENKKRDNETKEQERKKEEERMAKQKKLEDDLAKDREEHPLKYFIIDNISPINFQVMFGKRKEETSVEDINYIFNKDDKETTFWDTARIGDWNDYAVKFSSNGFYLRIKNKNEVINKENNKIIIDHPKAEYDLMDPKGPKINKTESLNFIDATDLFYKTARKYQEKLNEQFESKTN